jgi:hypothetical protein
MLSPVCDEKINQNESQKQRRTDKSKAKSGQELINQRREIVKKQKQRRTNKTKMKTTQKQTGEKNK